MYDHLCFQRVFPKWSWHFDYYVKLFPLSIRYCNEAWISKKERKNKRERKGRGIKGESYYCSLHVFPVVSLIFIFYVFLLFSETSAVIFARHPLRAFICHDLLLYSETLICVSYYRGDSNKVCVYEVWRGFSFFI